MDRRRIVRIFLIGLVVGGLLWSASPFARTDASGEGKQTQLSNLRTFNRVVLLVKENYVDPKRLDVRAMQMATLDAVEQWVPEIVITDLGDDNISVRVGKATKNFSLSGLSSLWDLSFKTRDIFRFLEQHLSAETDLQELEYVAVNGMLSKLDPHTRLLEPKISQDVKVSTKGEFGGLGVVISIRDGFLTVISPLEGTPAFKAGLKAQDRIIKIGEDSTVNMPLDDALEMLRGEAGTTVRLTVLSKGETKPRAVPVVRAIIKVDSVKAQLLDDGIGYVKVKAFQGNSSEEVRQSIEKLRKQSKQDLNGLILDFRNNPGGLLEQSVSLSNLFLNEGVIVVTQGAAPENREEELATNSGFKVDLPLVVIVNGGSASASEIVAGALKNQDRAIVIGQKSFGKGSVQMVYDFPDKSALKMTIAEYLTPGNQSIQSKGITPDILLRPIYADKKETLSLFADGQLREEDLERHLSEHEGRFEKPEHEIAFLADRIDFDEAERKALSKKVEEDFEMNFARRLLLRAKDSSRSGLLEQANELVAQVQEDEGKKLHQALKNFDINWEAPIVTVGKPQLSGRVVGIAKAKAGDKLKVTIEVKNEGSGPVWRVYGKSESATPLFAEREFFFGKISPKEKRIWTAEIDIPKEALPRKDLMRIKLLGNTNDDFGAVDVPIVVEGEQHPIFAHSYFIDDAKTGNADGTLEPSEKVDLVVAVKNIGKGKAPEPVILLKNQSGSDIFINEGRQNLKALNPGDVAFARFTFTLKKNVELAKMELQLYDAVMGDIWSDKIEFSVMANGRKSEPKPGFVQIVGDRVPLLAFAHEKSHAIAYLTDSQVLERLSMSGEMARVAVRPDLVGFVDLSKLKNVTAKPKEAGRLPELVFNRKPPQIVVAESKSPSVARDSYKLHIKVNDDLGFKDAMLFVNNKKVDYWSFAGKGPAADFEREIKLRPGDNSVTVVVREDNTYSHRETIHIYSENGDPLAVAAKSPL